MNPPDNKTIQLLKYLFPTLSTPTLFPDSPLAAAASAVFSSPPLPVSPREQNEQHAAHLRTKIPTIIQNSDTYIGIIENQ